MTMTEAEKWAERNLASSALGDLIRHLSAIVGVEDKKDAPDQEQIEKWLNGRYGHH